MRTEQGGLRILYNFCDASDMVFRVAVTDLGNTRAKISDDLVLWELSADTPQHLSEAETGEVPNGYKNTVALNRDFDGLLLAARIVVTGLPQGEGMTFSWDDVRAGDVLVGKKHMSVEEFRKKQACD